MNKKYVIEELNKKLNLEEEAMNKFIEIAEKHSIVGKKNKEEMTKAFIEEMNVDEETAELYYETLSSIIANGIKDKLKHPFGSNN